MNRPEQDQTVIDLQNLQAGLEWWRRRSSGWPADLHNREYYGIYEAREAGVTVDWWTATVDRLARWNALRTPVAGNTKAEILSRGKPLLDILSKLYANLILILKGEPLILSLEWVYAEPFFKLASLTKITSRPVFAAKMCHFLFPRLFISMDNRATGIFEYHTFWKEMRSEWDRLGKDERTVLIRTLEDAIDSDEPRHPLYPIETKIMELCRIGRTHRGDPVE